jgi:tetratricopeptide (TPR) repeat protein
VKKSARFYVYSAWIKSKQQYFAKALEFLQRAEKLDKKRADIPFLQSEICRMIGKREKAIEFIESSIKLSKSIPASCTTYACHLCCLGKVDRAFELLAASLKDSQWYPHLWYNIGVLYGLNGQFEDGLTAIRKAQDISDLDCFCEARMLLEKNISPDE